MVIPDTINALTMREAFLFYRDALKLNVRPLLGPWCGDPARAGKAPTIKEYWKRPTMEWDVERHFNNNGRCHNIGCGPREDLVFVDLDSKPDKGKSVRDFLAQNPEILRGPWHDTSNGVHLVFLCKDLPKADDILKGRPLDGITAELFHAGAVKCNIVLPPSVHVDAHIYRWAATGEVAEVSWAWLRDTFKFAEAEETKKGKDDRWFLKFKGDLKSLDLVGMLEHLGHPAQLEDADEGKHSILCPWHAEHGNGGKQGTSTVIWENDEEWPGFRCLHAHCEEKDLQALLEWAEKKEPGIVDRFCKRPRVFSPRYRDERGRPQILHPDDELISEVYTKLGKIIGPKRGWFMRGDSMVTINEVPSGFVYSDNPDTAYTVEATTVGFREITAQEARSRIEIYVIPGYISGETGTFIKKSFSPEFCISMVSSDHLRKRLPLIARVLTVPVPVRVGNELVFPKEGYDDRFGTFLMPGAPRIEEITLKRALRILEEIHGDFPFTSEQSKCHAIARLITPFARGLLGWTTRVPLWFYLANRPRAGKDYLAIIPLLVYEGYGFEDQPIDSRDSEETRKRIMAGARSGRHFMHFSNCQGHLSDQYFCQVITAQVIAGRALGSNDAAADLTLPNEMEFSMSGNAGGTYREDFEGRMRKIELAYYQDNANSRVFQNPFLHESIKEKRSEILSAIAALYRHWAEAGFPSGPSVFTSFPKWAQIVGGVMVAAGLGDPCLPFAGKFDAVSGDLETDAMRALFVVCRAKFGDAWTLKKEIYECVHEAMKEGNDALGYFGELKDSENARSNQTKLGKRLLRFKERELNEIILLIEEKKDASANKYRFIRDPNAPTDQNASQKSEPLNVSEHPGLDCLATPPLGPAVLSDDHGGVSLDSRVPGVQSGSDVQISLALDIETYAEIRLGKSGRPLKSKDALCAQKGDIRLVSVADAAGVITLRDLREESPLSCGEMAFLENHELIAHNAAFELRFLGYRLAIIPTKVFCTMTASKLLLPGREYSHKLGDVLERYLGVKIPKELGSSDWGGMVLTEEQLEYARNDVRYLHRLKDNLELEIIKAGLTEVFEMESRLILVTAAMEVHGFTINAGAMRALKAVSDTSAANLAAAIRQDFGNEKLNPASPAQLVKAFTEAGEDVENVDEETLMKLEDPRARTILQYRTAAKLSSNIETLLKAEHKGRIHSIFNPFGATTGRFSSKEPNLQNVTRGPLRACFIPSAPDRKLIVADYSQIELRVAALVARDAVMIEAFKTGEDLHFKTASSALGRPATKRERAQVGKATNFGFLYGQGPPGFVRYARTSYELMLSLDEAKVFHGRFFLLYAGLKKWHSRCWKLAEDPANCTARTIFGRLLMPDGDRAWNRFVMLTNYRVQGSCADLIKAAMLKTVSVLPKDVRLVATVHDELIFDAPVGMAGHYRDLIEQAMVDAFVEMFGEIVPVEVEAKVCNHWGDK
jgi:DNA polymerase I-like protein with 3'-5' exonuclease and polymerase domains